jgi:hypothetical protein
VSEKEKRNEVNIDVFFEGGKEEVSGDGGAEEASDGIGGDGGKVNESGVFQDGKVKKIPIRLDDGKRGFPFPFF